MDNLRIVSETLAGERPVDEQTHAAVAILAERLERLRLRSNLFAEIGFSPHVKNLKRQAEVLVLR
jgi:hypothetical protein